jgi:hypothetical protein
MKRKPENPPGRKPRGDIGSWSTLNHLPNRLGSVLASTLGPVERAAPGIPRSDASRSPASRGVVDRLVPRLAKASNVRPLALVVDVRGSGGSLGDLEPPAPDLPFLPALMPRRHRIFPWSSGRSQSPPLPRSTREYNLSRLSSAPLAVRAAPTSQYFKAASTATIGRYGTARHPELESDQTICARPRSAAEVSFRDDTRRSGTRGSHARVACRSSDPVVAPRGRER